MELIFICLLAQIHQMLVRARREIKVRSRIKLGRPEERRLKGSKKVD